MFIVAVKSGESKRSLRIVIVVLGNGCTVGTVYVAVHCTVCGFCGVCGTKLHTSDQFVAAVVHPFSSSSVCQSPPSICLLVSVS